MCGKTARTVRSGGGWKRSDLATVTAVKRPAGESRGKVAAGPDVRNRHRASPRPYSVPEARWLPWPSGSVASRLAAEAAYQCGALDRSKSLLADALAGLPADFDPVRRALLLERYALAQRESGWAAEAVATLREALALRPESQPSRVQAVVLATLASTLARSFDLEEGAHVAQRAVAAADAAGAKDVKADATITLGVAISYLGPAEAGLGPLRSGVALALELDIPATAVRGYINLSDVLELLGRHQEAARTASEGLELTARAGLSRTHGFYLISNQAESLMRLGEWAEVDEMTVRALRVIPRGYSAPPCGCCGPSFVPCAAAATTPSVSCGTRAGPSAPPTMSSSPSPCAALTR